MTLPLRKDIKNLIDESQDKCLTEGMTQQPLLLLYSHAVFLTKLKLFNIERDKFSTTNYSLILQFTKTSIIIIIIRTFSSREYLTL